MSRWPRAVLFDFDGVIVNSEPLHFRAMRNILAAEKIQLDEREYWDELIGYDDRGALKHVFESRGVAVEPKDLSRMMASKLRVMMELIHKESYQPLPGVEEFVRGLWWNYPLAICSGGRLEEIEAMLEGIALRDCFGVITSAEDVTHGKPHPEGYLLTMKRVAEQHKLESLSPEDCLVIEDAPSVIQSCRKAGFPVLGLATSHFEDKLEAAGADWVVRSLEIDVVKAKLHMLKVGV